MTDHYFNDERQKPFNPFLIDVKINDLFFSIYSASGIFSIKHIDKGTEILCKYADLSDSENKKVCDLGCGYGVVGIFVKKTNPDSNIFFIDINKRALRLVEMNLNKEKIQGTIIKSDVLKDVDDKFDVILTNPPYTAGRDVCFSFIKESFEKLNLNGSLQLVCRRQKGGDVLEKKMKEIFGNVKVIGQKSGFRVYKSVKMKD